MLTYGEHAILLQSNPRCSCSILHIYVSHAEVVSYVSVNVSVRKAISTRALAVVVVERQQTTKEIQFLESFFVDRLQLFLCFLIVVILYHIVFLQLGEALQHEVLAAPGLHIISYLGFFYLSSGGFRERPSTTAMIFRNFLLLLGSLFSISFNHNLNNVCSVVFASFQE